MQAMVLTPGGGPLVWTEMPDRQGPSEIRVKVAACGVCRTDQHVVDGEMPTPQFPIIPGHEIVGRIDALGAGVSDLKLGQRVGIPWLGHTCGVCPFCAMRRDNLCDRPLFTGCTRDVGFATATVADARFAFPLSDESLATLLCAGLIGWRSLTIASFSCRLLREERQLLSATTDMEKALEYLVASPPHPGGAGMSRASSPPGLWR